MHLGVSQATAEFDGVCIDIEQAIWKKMGAAHMDRLATCVPAEEGDHQ